LTIVDTTVWIDYLAGTVNPHTDWLDRELNQQRLGLTDLILCEILQGIRGDSAFKRVRRDLSNFAVFEARRSRWPPLRTIGPFDHVAIRSARPLTV
jgi:hypothetical protein